MNPLGVVKALSEFEAGSEFVGDGAADDVAKIGLRAQREASESDEAEESGERRQTTVPLFSM